MAIQVAQGEPAAIVTVGVTPTDTPGDWTALGAMQVQQQAGRMNGDLAYPLVRYVPRPSLDQAREMIQHSPAVQEQWMWDAGIYVMRISVIERWLHAHHPELFVAYQRMAQALERGDQHAAAASFAALRQPTGDGSIAQAVLLPAAPLG
jgi:mannose-1-phosphate guanylyltransferase